MSDVKEKVFKGSLWLSASKIIVNALALVSTIVLARLLLPEDFGLIALWAYSDLRLVNLTAVMAVMMLIHSMENPKFIAFQRDLVFTKVFILETVEKLTAFVVGIAAALILKNYWALIWGMGAAAVVRVAISYAVAPFRPRLSIQSWRSLMSFSIWLTLGKSLQAVNQRSVPLAIGAFLPTAVVGQYHIADRTFRTPSQEAIGSFQSVLFPAFVKLRSNPHRLRSAYLKGQGLLCMIAIPAGLGMAVLAEQIVQVILSAKWLPAVPIMQATGFAIAISPVQNARPVALGLGKPKYAFVRDVQCLVTRLPIIVLGLWLGGLSGLAVAIAISAVVNTLINMRLIKILIDIDIGKQIGAVLSPLLAGAAMVMCLIAIWQSPWAIFDNTGSLLNLIASIAIGALFYFLLLSGFFALKNNKTDAERELIQFFCSRLKSGQSDPQRSQN